MTAHFKHVLYLTLSEHRIPQLIFLFVCTACAIGLVLW